LAPPALSGGEPEKREFGAWVALLFHALKAIRKLRGTVWDVFGYTSERRMERRLIEDYRSLVMDLCRSLTSDNYDALKDLAAEAESIRGFGHIKRAAVDAYSQRLDEVRKRVC
jgi:indolepyruvate ferredoxin oxidoreductase